MAPSAYNAPVADVPFFTPQHVHSPGTPRELTVKTPTLFTPLQIRDVTLRNRVIVAPMCQYSTADSGPQIGRLTPYHVATLGHYALKGAALVFIEATGVQANGRISPNCPGLWCDDQIASVKAVADFVHSQGGLCGIQLAHAGRKASTVAPFVAERFGQRSRRATKDVGGWPEDVVGPSGGLQQSWDGKGEEDETGGYWPPRELTVKEIEQMVDDWKKAAMRAVTAGVDVIEIHGAHGYLIHQFLSPITNRRTDSYGGSFENRSRLAVDIISAIRSVIPATMPLFLRLSSTEWMEETTLGKDLGSWTIEDTIALAKVSSDMGVDLLDVSSGGNHPAQRINMFDSKDYQTRIAGRIREELRLAGKSLLIGAVGLITEAEQASGIVQQDRLGSGSNSSTVVATDEEKHTQVQAGDLAEEAKVAAQMTDAKGKQPMADAVLIARQFMREPEWVLKVAWRLGVDVAWPMQFNRVRFPKL
ncbi:hypothetical protein B0A50_01965 [Salinomyces thailandicus]|uniref:NADH:flavin oxidoreductase/NADH oxidase N-terminal domain-containing protein n=1 Tax=Salinomyces thailandicus TaxID=706561 RepID=A0A4U0U7J4_9PEZI|nr:hypothetical protein B0A50_01965 [Salinomyces thailandica]